MLLAIDKSDTYANALNVYRHYGLFANANRADNIAKVRALLGADPPAADPLRIPMMSATHSNRKPATDSDLKPAGVPI